MLGSTDESLGGKMNCFDMITPDGQPVRWAMNLLHRTGLRERVRGADLTAAVCRLAAAKQVPVYLYGSTPEVMAAFRESLASRHPGLRLAGAEPHPHRDLTPEEDEAAVRRINASGAGILFVGIGCPRQDLFAYEHRGRIQPVQVCVGAVFDFFAGNKKIAPEWMQRLPAWNGSSASARSLAACGAGIWSRTPSSCCCWPGQCSDGADHQRFRRTRSGRKRLTGGGFSAGKPSTTKLCAITPSGRAKRFRKPSIRSGRG